MEKEDSIVIRWNRFAGLLLLKRSLAGARCDTVRRGFNNHQMSPRMKLRVKSSGFETNLGKNRSFLQGLRKLRFLHDYWELEAEIFCGFGSRSVAFISGGFWRNNYEKI